MRIVMMGTGTFAEPTFEALLQAFSSQLSFHATTGNFAEPIFEALRAGPNPVVGLVTQPDRPTGAERGSTRQTGRGMKNIALAHSLPIFQPENINTPEGAEGLRALQPDLVVVAAYGQILSRDILAIPPQGGINVHASLLPKYRGAAPVAWAIYHGEKETGVTIIRMSVSLDAGDILAQETIAIDPTETAGELEARLAPLGARLAVQVAGQIASGTATGTKQDKALVTKAPKLTKENGLIDWTRSAEQVSNQVRAMQPWPTAYTYLHRQGQPPLRLIIGKAVRLAAADADNAAPGQVVIRPEAASQLIVAAGNGTLVEIQELQPAGKRRMAAAEFLRGHRVKPGDRLGPEKE